MQWMDGGLWTTLARETFLRRQFARRPEQDLVMTGEESVASFVRAGRAGGSLSAAYLFHAEQISRVIRPGDTVLDVACGPAILLTQVAELDRETSFIGVDLSEPMLEHARARVADLKLDNVRLMPGDMTVLEGVETASVDAVVSTFSLHHLPDEEALERAFAAIGRVLKPGGGVYLSDFGRLKRLASVEFFVSRSAPGEDPVLVHDLRQSLLAAFTRQDLESLALAHLRGQVRVFATAVAPVVVVIKSAQRRQAEEVLKHLRDRAAALPAARRRELAQLRLLMRLAGLPSSL